MFRRWAEGRMYRKTVQLAVSELRHAARTPDPLEKIRSLEVAEQKLKDALWLCPERSKEQFEEGLAELQRGRQRALREQALPAVAQLLERVEEGRADGEGMLELAGELLSFLNHYLPDDRETEALDARFRQLGGKQRPYRASAPLSEIYHRPEGGVGCATMLVCLVVGLVLLGFLPK